MGQGFSQSWTCVTCYFVWNWQGDKFFSKGKFEYLAVLAQKSSSKCSVSLVLLQTIWFHSLASACFQEWQAGHLVPVLCCPRQCSLVPQGRVVGQEAVWGVESHVRWAFSGVEVHHEHLADIRHFVGTYSQMQVQRCYISTPTEGYPNPSVVWQALQIAYTHCTIAFILLADPPKLCQVWWELLVDSRVFRSVMKCLIGFKSGTLKEVYLHRSYFILAVSWWTWCHEFSGSGIH